MGIFFPGFGINLIRPKAHEGGQEPDSNHKLLKVARIVRNSEGQDEGWDGRYRRARETIVLVMPSAPGAFSGPEREPQISVAVSREHSGSQTLGGSPLEFHW